MKRLFQGNVARLTEVPSPLILFVVDGAVVKVCTVVVVFISVDMQLHQCYMTGRSWTLDRDFVTVEGMVKNVFRARLCKRLWSPGIDSASLQ